MKQDTKPVAVNGTSKPGERTGRSCPVCGDNVLKQEAFGKANAAGPHRLVCSRRGCPWQGQMP